MKATAELKTKRLAMLMRLWLIAAYFAQNCIHLQVISRTNDRRAHAAASSSVSKGRQP